MTSHISKNKLIILLNLSGSYKGGAQRRYLALFNYLQKINKNDYFLLLNDALFDECFRDGILSNKKNIIQVKIKYGRVKSDRNTSAFISLNSINKSNKKNLSSLYNNLGLFSSFLKQTRGWIGYSVQLIKIIKRYNIGLLYGVFTGGIWSWQAARLMNINLIYSYNDSAATTIDRELIKILNSEYYTVRFANKVDFLSEGILEKLNGKGITLNQNRILFTPNSFILYDNFFPEIPKNNWVVFSARLTRVKNPHLLLEAVSLLKKRGYTNFKVYFLGEGFLLPELMNKKNELKLDNILFEGGVPDTAIYLRKSKIFVSLQTDNNYPSQSLLEAMACENAVIASDVGETRKLVTENEGILVPLDAEKIADALITLLSNPDDCERMGKNAREKALNEHNIEKYLQYFLEITKT